MLGNTEKYFTQIHVCTRVYKSMCDKYSTHFHILAFRGKIARYSSVFRFFLLTTVAVSLNNKINRFRWLQKKKH